MKAVYLMNESLVVRKKIEAVAANNDEMSIGAIIRSSRPQGSEENCHRWRRRTRDALAEMEKGNLGWTVFQDAIRSGQGCGGIPPSS